MTQELLIIRKLISTAKSEQDNNKNVSHQNNTQKLPEINSNLSNLSNEIILQQQKLLENYRRQLERLINQKQKQVVIVQKQIATNNSNTFDSHPLSKAIVRNETQSIAQSYNFNVPHPNSNYTAGFNYSTAKPVNVNYSIPQPMSFNIAQPIKSAHIDPPTILPHINKITFTQAHPYISQLSKQTPLKQNIIKSSQSNQKNNTFTIVQKLFNTQKKQQHHINNNSLNQIQTYQIKDKIDQLDKQTKIQLTDNQRSRIRHQNIKKKQFYGYYPYTKYLVLEEIGLKQQVLFSENQRKQILKIQQTAKSYQDTKKLSDFQFKDQAQQEQIIHRNKSIRENIKINGKNMITKIMVQKICQICAVHYSLAEIINQQIYY